MSALDIIVTDCFSDIKKSFARLNDKQIKLRYKNSRTKPELQYYATPNTAITCHNCLAILCHAIIAKLIEDYDWNILLMQYQLYDLFEKP